MINECSICKGDNLCGNVSKAIEPCWCTKKIFPQAVFQQIPERQLYKQCICEACLDRITKIEQASKRSNDR